MRATGLCWVLWLQGQTLATHSMVIKPYTSSWYMFLHCILKMFTAKEKKLASITFNKMLLLLLLLLPLETSIIVRAAHCNAQSGEACVLE